MLPTPTPLTDITRHWSEPFIRGLVTRRIINGFPDRTFRPNLGVTRVQYAMLITKAFNLPTRRSRSTFIDVPADYWGAAAIGKAEEMGFILGFPDRTFRPDDPLTRLQAIGSLVTGLGWSGEQPAGLSVFRDRAQIPSYATAAVATAVAKQIVVAFPQVDLLNPSQVISRAEIAAMLYQVFVSQGFAAAIPSPYIVSPDPSIVSFSDTPGHWAADFIRALASQDYVQGTTSGRFEPDRSMTRAEYAALLTRIFRPAAQRPPRTFSDVPADFWAAGIIQQAFRSGLMAGYDDGTFRPHEQVPRWQVLLSLSSTLKLASADLALLSRYTDADRIPPFAQAAIASATNHWLVVNHPSIKQLDPAGVATRAMVAAMVYQALVYADRASPVVSPYIIDPTNPNQTDPQPTATEPIVLIDPGHGGPDPGAVGIGGIQEKDIVLPVSLQMARLLQQRGVKVVMTRSDDRDLDLAPRVQIATQANATVFISIHANAISLSRPEINGLETFHHPTSTEGAKLAQAIHRSILRRVEVDDRGVRTANFFVLRLAPMPSCLVELGYVTGQRDAVNLGRSEYRHAMAGAIVEGILQYVRALGFTVQ